MGMLVEPDLLSENIQTPGNIQGHEHRTSSAKIMKTVMSKDISCNNFRGLILYLRKHYGEEGVQAVIGELINNENYLIADKYDPARIIPIQEEHLTDPAYWVSNEFSLRLLSNVSKVVRSPSPLFSAAEGAVRETLSKSVFFISRIVGPKFLLKQAQRLNARFNRTKKLKLIELKDSIAIIELQYYPGYRITKDVCEWNRGIYTEVLRSAGLKNVHCEETKCCLEGGDSCIFHITWQKANVFSRLFKAVITILMRWATGDLVAEYEAAVRDRDTLIDNLKLSEEKYRSVFESSATATLMVEKDFTISMVNGEFERLSGYTREELEGKKTWPDFLPKEDFDNLEDYCARKFANKIKEPVPVEVRFYDRHGNIRNVLVKIGKIPGSDTRVFSLIDITSRKRVEKALRESEEKYRNILQSIEEGYFESDLSGKLTFINESVCKILGYFRREILGKKYEDFVSPETANKMFSTFQGVFKTGRPVKVSNHEFIKKDGSKIILELSANLMRDEHRNPIGFRGIMRDVTERIQAEAERKKLEAKLQQAKRMEAIGTLAGGVAHDLNNILSGIVSYPELLLMQLAPDDPLRKPIITIQKSGEKAATIVQDLLTLARRGVAVTEVINLNKIVSEYLVSPEYEKLKSFHPEVNVVTRLEDDLLNIVGSPVHLSKTVMNLISNAAEAMPDGGEILITTENCYLDNLLEGTELREGEYIILKVADTGIGMSPEDKERIFEPFYTKKVMGRSGTGLGMAVVWGTVQDHKGYIRVDSEKGKGTTFTLYFPATRKRLSEHKKVKFSLEEYMGKGESILVVDDVKEQREIATEILKRLNYSVEAVASGEEAIEYVKQRPVDSLVLDMIMEPGIDGLETYKRILQIRPGQKAVIVSGFSESDRVKEAQEMGAGTYVRKPYSLEKIGLALRKELDRRN